MEGDKGRGRQGTANMDLDSSTVLVGLVGRTKSLQRLHTYSELTGFTTTLPHSTTVPHNLVQVLRV